MSNPSQSVILLGIPQNADDPMVRNFLEDMGCQIDTITIIFDKETGVSKRFAFARFVSVEHARSFVEPNFPSVVWHDRTGRGDPADNGLRVKIDYSQTDRPPNRPGGPPRASLAARQRTQAVQQKSCYTHPHRTASPPKAPLEPPRPVNDGQRDIGPAPSATLLIRGLDPLTREHEIASALDGQSGLAASVAAGDGARMVMLAKDRITKASLGFAFVTYKDAKVRRARATPLHSSRWSTIAQVALKVLTVIWDPEIHAQGFRIRGHTVTATFGHGESFRPAYATSSYSFKTEQGKEMLYWDDKAFVTAWSSPSLPPPPPPPQPIDDVASDDIDVDDTDAFFASIGPAPSSTSTTTTIDLAHSASASQPAQPAQVHIQAPQPLRTLESRLSHEKALQDRRTTASSSPVPPPPIESVALSCLLPSVEIDTKDLAVRRRRKLKRRRSRPSSSPARGCARRCAPCAQA
jgi:hypothetical protein